MIAGILVPLASFAMIFGIVYIIVTARNRERLSLIEKGADPKLFESIKKTSSGGLLKWALLMIGIGLGIFLAAALANAGFDEDAAYPAMILLCGGLGLLLAHRMEQKANTLKDKE